MADLSNKGIKRGAGKVASAGIGAAVKTKNYFDSDRDARIKAAADQAAAEQAAKDAANQDYWRKRGEDVPPAKRFADGGAVPDLAGLYDRYKPRAVQPSSATGAQLNAESIQGLRNEAGPVAASRMAPGTYAPTGVGIYGMSRDMNTTALAPAALPAPPAAIQTPAAITPPASVARPAVVAPPNMDSDIAAASLAGYNKYMNKEGGTMGDAIVARGFMNQYQKLLPMQNAENKTALEAYDAFGRQQQAASAPKESPAMERLRAAQAGTVEGQGRATQRLEFLLQGMNDPGIPEAKRKAMRDEYLMVRGSKETADPTQQKMDEYMISEGINPRTGQKILPGTGMADGGVVRGYADGGAVGRDLARPAPPINPLIAQYGQYLTAAASAGVPPVPFMQYQNLLQTTRASMQGQPPVGFADGGDVSALGRTLEGPGTGTSDSIPAVIDGVQPAALSRDEFVFPAEVTKYYGTKFMNDLIAKAKTALSGEGATAGAA